MVRKYVYGVFPTVMEVEEAANFVRNQGVPAGSIAIVGNDRYEYSGEAEYITYSELIEEQHEDNRGFFAKLFDLGDDDEFDNIDVDTYRDSLNRDELLLLIDEEYQNNLPAFYSTENEAHDPLFNNNDVSVSDPTLVDERDTVRDTQPGYNQEVTRDEYSDRDNYHDNLNNETETIRLHEEQLKTEKRRHDLGEVEISKEVVEENKTIDVPVEREEIHIRHKKPTDGYVEDEAFEDEDIVIPVSEEEVIVNKDTVVTDEIEIEKTKHTDHKSVNENTRREELEIHDETGRVIDEDDDSLL